MAVTVGSCQELSDVTTARKAGYLPYGQTPDFSVLVMAAKEQ